MKSFLFVMQTPAYSGVKVQEVLDMVLISAAFDQKVSLLLLDDGVFQIKRNQHNKLPGFKDIGAIYRSLKLYDIENIYVELESLIQHGLSTNDLQTPVTIVNRKDVAGIFRSFDLILNG